MKKRNLLALMLLGASLMFVGCGGKPSDDPTKDENNTNQPGTDDTDKKDDAASDTDDSNAGSVWKVTFDLNGGSGTAPAEQEIEDGKTATEPSIEGITGPEDKPNFAGWTTTADDESTKFSFTTKITANTKLYAFWSAEKYYKVTFSTGDEATTTSDQVKDGNKATKPATDPRKVGYKLAGWYADSAFATAFDFDSAITADTTVYAKFVKAYKVFYEKMETEQVAVDDQYGGYTFWGSNGVELKKGDWLILSAKVEYENIGQIHPQIGFTPVVGAADYPYIGQYYNDSKYNDLVDSYDYYGIYKVPEDGTITMAKFNFADCNDATDTVTNLAQGTNVTLTGVKLVHIPAADLTCALPYYLSKSSVTLEDAGEGMFKYAPTVKFIAPENSTLTCSYTRNEVSAAYKTHFLNSNAGWMATYPDSAAGAISISGVVTYRDASHEKGEFTGEITYLEVGTQEITGKNGADIVLTGLEIANIPELSFFELD